MVSKILFFAGSARKDSLNKKLARLAYNKAIAMGLEASFIDLKDYPMPIYDGDLEAESGMPDNAKKLQEIFIKHDAIFIASPEYNSSFSPLLKNSLDWISRQQFAGQDSLIAYQNKVASICAASLGMLGGIRGLVPLRLMLSNIGVTVLPTQVCVAQAHNEFDHNGHLKNNNYDQMLDKMLLEMQRISINHLS
jgi:chromate reductase, NAD(P)H dehydrogenase (quinone)